MTQSSSNLPPLSFDVEVWPLAEQRIEEILGTFQPTVVSQNKRKEVIEYLSQLISGHFGLEIYAYGSVLLRTYLPDGDIDVTVLCHQSSVENSIRGLCSMVEQRENSDGIFKMKDVQVIHAQVKIVKFIVKNIAVDVSFNQVAGLGALCFLEQVDRLIGREHLFKRSVLLVKAWCFYEGRLLGSQNGLISTYGLEIMVLCIINIFHASVSGPLGVLYKFLDYFSKFDWQHFCVSIYGPVVIEFLPELQVDSTGMDVDQLLLSKDFLRSYKEQCSVADPDDLTRRLHVKHLNIVDPLKESNNLGRSVSKGNALRIKCAFSYGVRKLGEILMLPIEKMVQQLETFFINTLDRNGRGVRLDVDAPVPVFGTGKFERFSLTGELESFYNDFRHGMRHQEYARASDQPRSLSSVAFNAPAPPPTSSNNPNDEQWNPSFSFHVQSLAAPATWSSADSFVPGTLIQRQSPGAATNSDLGRSRGTGPYIPHVGQHPPLRRQQSLSRSRSSGFTRNWSVKEAAVAIEAPKKEEGGGSGCLDLSVEQFPLLSSLEKTDSIAIVKTNQSEVVLPQAEKIICFENIQPSVGQSSSVITNKNLPCPPLEETSSSGGSSEKCNDPKFMNTGESSTERPFQLEDEGEFPPLAQ